VGTLADAVLPQWLIVVLLFTVLSAMSYRTAKKGLTAMRLEAQARPSASLEQPLLETEEEEDEKSSARRRACRAPLPPLFPRDRLGLTALAWLTVVALALARGGHGVPSLLPVSCGSGGFWALLAVAWLALGALTALVRARLLRERDSSLEAFGTAFGTARLAWNPTSTILVPATSAAVGVLAGLLGIGGGMLIGPLLLELGVEPLGVAATGAFVVLVTDSAIAMQYAVMGALPPAWQALLLATCAFMATMLGQMVSERIIQRRGTPSLVTLIIAGVIALSTFATGFVAARNLASTSGGWGFRPLCGSYGCC